MNTTLLILLTVAIFSSSNGDFADNILKKQEECDTVKIKVSDAVLDEGGDKFPGIPEEYYNNCKNDLDKLKIVYLDKFHLSSQLYPEVFPALLSNETLILLPSPSKTDSSILLDTQLCSSCESLCIVYEKCSSLLEKINHNIQSSGKVSKDKYNQCMELLNGQKIKFIHDHNISKELLKGASYIGLNCNKRHILLTLPRLLKLGFQDALNSRRSEKPISAPTYSKGLGDSDDRYGGSDDKVDVKAFSNKKVEEGPQHSSLDIEGYNSENSNNVQENAGMQVGTQFDNFSEDIKQKDTQEINKSSIEETGGMLKMKQTHLASTFANNNNKGGKNNLLVKIQPDAGNKLNPEPKSTGDRDHNQKIMMDDQSVPGIIVTATPIPETLGDEIFEKEADCDEILKMANNMLEFRTFDSVRYYDDQYTECKQSLHKIKYEYAERHGIIFDDYKSVFPVALSTGVEKLVSLPGKVRESQIANHPKVSSPTTFFSLGDLTEHPVKEELTRSVLYNGGRGERITNRTPLYNPAFISNEEFYAYFTKSSQSTGETTFSRFTKMIRKNAGHSDRPAL